MKDINISDGIFILSPGSCTRGRTSGYRGGLSDPKIFFSKIQPDFVCELLTSMAHATAQFFLSPPPGALGRGKKVKYHKSQSLSQFQRFLNQTLCVFSQMKDIKHIRRDFYSVAWVMPQGWDFGVPWGVGGPIFFFLQNSTRFGV